MANESHSHQATSAPSLAVFDEAKAREAIGKTLLAGITHLDREGNVTSQKQFFGRIVKASPKGIVIEQQSGELFTLPPDMESLSPARPGVYRLRSTGQEITDPDFLSTWEVTAPAQGR